MLRKGEALAPPLLICTIVLFRAASFFFSPNDFNFHYLNISYNFNLDILGHSNIGLTFKSVPEGLGAVCA